MIQEQPRRLRALLVGRVSTSDKQQDPESQLRALRELSHRQGWEIAGELRLHMSAWDDASAAEVRRQALEPLRQGRADVLVVWALDRIHRGTVPQAFRFLSEIEVHLACRFHSLQEPFLCTGANPEQRELMLSIRSWAARWDSERKSERLREKVRTKRRAAEIGGGRARWGRGRLPTAGDVREIWRLRGERLTQLEISRRTGLSQPTISRVLARGVDYPPQAENTVPSPSEKEGRPDVED
ncbi:MAG: recombinase family protein [Euryarchaeota archaeon]|nr:recombinase family protein [Euryarchaeota archaeon]MDE1881168.1 recombinase family protein [Euryarchaeota archaeon]